MEMRADNKTEEKGCGYTQKGDELQGSGSELVTLKKNANGEKTYQRSCRKPHQLKGVPTVIGLNILKGWCGRAILRGKERISPARSSQNEMQGKLEIVQGIRLQRTKRRKAPSRQGYIWGRGTRVTKEVRYEKKKYEGAARKKI